MASEVIQLNLIPKGDMPVFHASQFDTGRLITCELYRGEDAYTVPEGYTVELHCRKVDNNIVTMESTLINDNVVTFTSTEQLTACNGKNLCEVAILDEGYRIGTLNFILEVEVDPLKGGITSTSEIHNLETQIEEITTEIVGENYYTKTETDALLDDKADSDTVYTKTETDTKLALKADASSVYTKSQVDTALALKANAADVYTKTQVDTALALKADAADVYTKSQVDTALALKADAADVYTKTQVDTALALKADAADVYTKSQVDTALALKADASSVYTKSQVDTALALKADAADVYTKTQVDTALALKADAADVYTKTEVYNKTETYTQAEVDALIDSIFPTFTATGAIASFTTALAKPLVSVTADAGATTVTACGVNLFKNTATSTTINDVVFTINSDGTFTANGTATGGNSQITLGTISLPAGSYCISDSSDFTRNNDIELYISGVSSTTTKYLDNRTFTINEPVTNKNVFFFVGNGKSINTTIKPMIRISSITDTTYHGYTGNTVPVADATTLTTQSGFNNVFADTGDITVQYKYMSM